MFNRTGVSHLISISGLHVTAFAALAGALVFALVRRVPVVTMRVPARKVAVAVGALLAAAYVLIAGNPFNRAAATPTYQTTPASLGTVQTTVSATGPITLPASVPSSR